MPPTDEMRTPRWRVLYAFQALGSGERLRALRDSDLFDTRSYQHYLSLPPHRQLRYVADEVLRMQASDEFVVVCEATASGRSDDR